MIVQTALMNVMIRAADKATRRLRRDFNETENLQVSRKGPADFVSTADTMAERTIREELERARPGYGFLMEESGSRKGTDETRRWIVDPLDGTTNFLHALPHWAISIALEERGEIVAGLVYDPIKNELFRAEKGGGAYLNDRRIRVSARRRFEEALIATGALGGGPGSDETKALETEVAAVTAKAAGIRRWGAAALDLAYVACGRFDAFWDRNLSPWDLAAGVIVLREAGGLVSRIDGRAFRIDSDNILAGNEEIHPALVKTLKVAKTAPDAA
ncbi:MAG TPA: inositol monophosphatase family protein [Kiloniellaceae bacterium]|nr:inositol monophosphatase family protein [Kiloniellaceae bacterium]